MTELDKIEKRQKKDHSIQLEHLQISVKKNWKVLCKIVS